MNQQKTQESNTDGIKVSRRQVIMAGGSTLIGAALLGSNFGVPALAQTNISDTMKPVMLPGQGSTDPVDFSIAENAFWNEQLMEHAAFFIMLMPGAELADERKQAEQFRDKFAGQLTKSRSAKLDRSNYAAFNRSTIEMVKPFAEWKRRNGDLQASGKLRSLTWSTFFDHTALEAERFSRRLDQFSKGDTSTDLREASSFWTQIMGEHADFIAHLLDPAERDLIMKAMKTSEAFHKMHDQPVSSKDPLERAINEIIDFKTAAENGIKMGKIKSIIHPTLADHVRREALKAADDLKRAA
jgi:hypothetical protein